MRVLRKSSLRQAKSRLVGNTSMLANRRAMSWAGVAAMVVVTLTAGIVVKLHSHAATAVPGQNYMICDNPGTFLTSPWTYHALASGSQNYTVAQYQALSGYGTTLPPLPSYISAQASGTTAAVIYAPGADVSPPAYSLPSTPILQFFEGGSFGHLGMQTISGDEFIGGSSTGFPEPQFNDGGAPGGIDSGNDSYSFGGGTSTLASTANPGATTVTTTSNISAYANQITFADGNTYGIAGGTLTSVQLNSPLTSSEAAGSAEWTNSTAPIGKVSAVKAQGATTVTFTGLTMPLVQWGNIAIGDHSYRISSLTGTESSGYTVTFTRGLDMAVAANTPVYYGAANMGAGGVTVSYLDISNDLHGTTGTLTIGSGWTITHNKIHDSYRNPGEGVAFYGGDESTIEYNCFSKMGSSGAGGSGTNEVFDYNEVYQAGFEGDPGCGCTGNKWWGSLNADIVDNAFIEMGVGGGTPAIWLDNGNSGTNISGNYFYHNIDNAVESETGFNLNVTNNLMVDDNWGPTGIGCGDSNCTGEVILNSSGGFHVPNSRYDNQINVSGNQFINDWGGVTIWESGLRNCAFSGEGDSAYCTGGFPNTELAAQGGQYYFSHERNSIDGDTSFVDQTASAGSTTLLVQNAEAINDQIGFADEARTTTSSTTNTTTLSGSTINAASTAAFPNSGQLRADTTALSTGGNTGAILSYTGKTATSFTGVSFVRGSGNLNGQLIQIQPYKVVSQTCYANDCALTISPALTSPVTAGTTVASTGTCPLFGSLPTTTPTNPMAPNGAGSYYDGCQWGTKHISITNNDFQFDPAAIAAGTTATGHVVGANCTAAHANQCGTNFMMDQSDGELPYGTAIDGNAMFSNSSFTTCPAWDSGCTSDPFSNLNSLPNAPAAPPSNGEAPSNNLWNNNTYEGPWAFNAWNYGPCNFYPTDPQTGKSVPTTPDPCSLLSFATWQSDWQQDSASTYSATVTPTPSSGVTPTPTPTPTPSGTPSGKIGDLNNDNLVNVFDLSILLSGWGTSNATDDLSHDGTVNVFDLSIMLSHWGT